MDMRSMRLRSGLAALVIGALAAGSHSTIATAQDSSALATEGAAFTGDFDGMMQRRSIRVLVPVNPLFFFIDAGEQTGITADVLNAFQDWLHERHQLGTQRIDVVFIPTRRDELLSGLVEGLGDIAAGNLTITPEREEIVAFSDPVYPGVNEILITNASGPQIASIEDLAGQSVHVRASSSYFASLTSLNERFEDSDLVPIEIVETDENLEDGDILELVNANIVPMTIVDSHKAELWTQVYDDLAAYPEIAVRTDGRIGWAVRQDNPMLLAEINAFVPEIRKGSLLGNIILREYLSDVDRLREIRSPETVERLRATYDLFTKYSDTFGFDTLMIIAQAYQESRLDHSVVSPAGAVGIMQVLPTTAADPTVDIAGIEELENNIHAGTKYLRWVVDNFLSDPELDETNRLLLAFASYNAGPTRIATLRQQAASEGLDPNVWFRNVDQIVAREIGRETWRYVRNIYKYYLAYEGFVEARLANIEAEEAAGSDP